MPDLILLRHAKSDWKAAYGTDRDRPLNKRGIRSARAVGEFVARYGLVPELVLASPAVRTRTTAELAAEAGGWTSCIEVVPGLYGADYGEVIQLVREVTEVERLMVVGHEPTMSGVLEYLTGHRIRVTTATLAYMRSGYGSWSDLACGTARLELLVRPRLLLD
ncbi:MAG: histidine phosphatase family protein [Acidimicrobiia bacterium]|nr:histidine phosphatase family protein [Acidimicrobiia bacterium]MYC84124.1 histidine phosphatase family protein [Acidimicrobiia bacterium]